MNEAVKAFDASDEGYISKVEMARRMDVSTRTIEVWMREKKVPFEKIGRTVRFYWGDVRSYLSRRNAIVAQPGTQLRPTEGTHDRMRQLAAAIRRQQRHGKKKAGVDLGIADDNSQPPEIRRRQ